jgi:hypothetical protein
VAVAVTLKLHRSSVRYVDLIFHVQRANDEGEVHPLVCSVLGVALTSGLAEAGAGGLNVNIPGVLAGLLSGLSYGSQTIVYKKVGTRYGPSH